MDQKTIEKILVQVKEGSLEPEAALHELRNLNFEDLNFARLDHHRALRQGMPEVVFAQGKSPGQAALILSSLAKKNPLVFATRADTEHFTAVKKNLPQVVYHKEARIIAVGEAPKPQADSGLVLVVSAGTSDQAVSEEALVTAELLGLRTERLYDVGVAGIHRLLAHQKLLQEAALIIVVAGMEGALPSVVGGIVSSPVIAVPTSVGYGASFGGLAALLSMMNSCAAGITVVNIDNGFGAAVSAYRILSLNIKDKNDSGKPNPA